MSRLFDLLERVNEKFPPDETSNSEEARKRRRSQIIGRVIGKTDTAEVQTEETLRRVGLPMAEVATWQIEAALRATGGVISKAAEKLRVSRVTLWRRIRREPHLRDVVFECRETLLDEAEGVLLAEIEKGKGLRDFAAVPLGKDYLSGFRNSAVGKLTPVQVTR